MEDKEGRERKGKMKRNRRITQDHTHAQKLARSMNSHTLSMHTQDRSVIVMVVVMILTTRERKTLSTPPITIVSLDALAPPNKQPSATAAAPLLSSPTNVKKHTKQFRIHE